MSKKQEAKKAKREALARVWKGSDQAWVNKATRTLIKVANARPEFTTDDLWEAGLPRPREPRALGAVMNDAARRRYVKATKRYQQSNRRACHARPVRVWRSMVHHGTAS